MQCLYIYGSTFKYIRCFYLLYYITLYSADFLKSISNPQCTISSVFIHLLQAYADGGTPNIYYLETNYISFYIGLVYVTACSANRDLISAGNQFPDMGIRDSCGPFY